MSPVWITLLIVLAVLIAAVLAYILLRFLWYRSGSLAGRKVSGALKKFGVIRNYKVLNDVHVSVGGREARIAHMLVGFFGVLVVESVNDTAEYYGTVKDAAWTKVDKKQKRTRIDNLVERNVQNIDVVREIFSKNNVFGIKMEGVVVFCGGRKKTLIGVTGDPCLMTFDKFKKYITKSKFEKDNDVDVPLLCGLIDKYRA